MKKTILSLTIFVLLATSSVAFASFKNPLSGFLNNFYQIQLAYFQKGNVVVSNPEAAQNFYDELKGAARDYVITSNQNFNLSVTILVPVIINPNGQYSAKLFSVNQSGETQIAVLDGSIADWKQYYDNVGRDYYLKGPSLNQELLAGKYKIEVYSDNNTGKYVLALGARPVYTLLSVANAFWELPLLKASFLKTDVLQFFLTPFGVVGITAVGVLLILLVILFAIVGVIKQFIRHNQAKTLLLASGGMAEMKEDIKKLLQKPAYDITVAFVSTAAKPEEDVAYMQKDWLVMRDEMGFNLEEVDIDGKTEEQVMKLLELKDIIFVEGGNAFYLLNAMRKCNFEKIIRKLLKEGKVYIGVSAGSIVAGNTIQTADKFGTGSRNRFGVTDLRGLRLVPFDILPHFAPEMADIITKKMKSARKRRKKLRIITDQQAILVQGREVDLIGEGEQIII